MTEEEIIDELLSLASRNGIEVTNVTTHDDSSPDVAFPFISRIMMNPHYQTSYSFVFRLAHEISHILFGDNDLLPYYRFSPFFLKAEENSANTNAIRLIARIVYHDVPAEQRNWIEFMDRLGLQSHFEPVVKRVLYN